MIADLHIHTTASDGRFSPEEIWKQAQEANLKYIAVTDHDTVDGVRTLKKVSQREPLLIPGIELNTDLPDYEVHILGYNIDIENSTLNAELKKIAEDRVLRAKKMIAKLDVLGFPIEYEHVLKIAGTSKSIGRPHVAKALLEKGYFSSMDEIFGSLLEKNGPAYVPHYKLTPAEAIKLIKAAGGTSVLAHPGLIGSDEVVHTMIGQGIQGIEAYHPKHSDEQENKYIYLADKFGLLVTGGSDYHGIPGRVPERLGQFTVPAWLAEKLV